MIIQGRRHKMFPIRRRDQAECSREREAYWSFTKGFAPLLRVTLIDLMSGGRGNLEPYNLSKCRVEKGDTIQFHFHCCCLHRGLNEP